MEGSQGAKTSLSMTCAPGRQLPFSSTYVGNAIEVVFILPSQTWPHILKIMRSISALERPDRCSSANSERLVRAKSSSMVSLRAASFRPAVPCWIAVESFEVRAGARCGRVFPPQIPRRVPPAAKAWTSNNRWRDRQASSTDAADGPGREHRRCDRCRCGSQPTGRHEVPAFGGSKLTLGRRPQDTGILGTTIDRCREARARDN